MYIYNVLEVISVYDGDTCTLRLDLGFNIHSIQTIRLRGINAPELRGETLEPARKSRNFLIEQLKSADSIIIKTHKDSTEKYGRLLGEIFVDGEEISVNQKLVTEGLAVEYMV